MTAREQLLAGKAYLEEHRWRQIWDVDPEVAWPEGSVCAQQALTCANEAIDSSRDVAMQALAAAMGWDPSMDADAISFIWLWNDEEGRLPQDVFRAFDKAIEATRETEGGYA